MKAAISLPDPVPAWCIPTAGDEEYNSIVALDYRKDPNYIAEFGELSVVARVP